MKKVSVTLKAPLPSSYPIMIGENILYKISSFIPKNISSIVIITDNTVKIHYASFLKKTLEEKKYKIFILSFPAGEKFKNFHTKQILEEKMLMNSCGRDTLILALGGGVSGDLAGFVAATYMRGIPYIQIPTTLLAMIDSSIGGKTAINTKYGKNMIGAFWQPKAVILDIAFLETLSQKHLINGLIEAIKIFLTSDFKSLNFLQKNLSSIIERTPKTLTQLVEKAVKIKASIVENDEKESAQRAILNFGHTIGHALEQLSNYKMLHGIAVAYGILIESKIAQLLGYLTEEDYHHIEKIFSILNIKPKNIKKFSIEKIIELTKLDKKSRLGVVNYVLINGLGSTYSKRNQFTHEVSDKTVREAFYQTIEGKI